MEKMADITGILLKNLGQILQKFSGKRNKEIGFVLFSQMFLMKQNGN